jgi:glucose-1-phosphate adenylyltransferase
MVSGGCIISGATVRESLLSSDVVIDEFTTVVRSVVLPDVEIGRNCYIANSIIDEGSVIPDNLIIGMNADDDRRRFYVSPKGVVLVTRGMLARLQDLASQPEPDSAG